MIYITAYGKNRFGLWRAFWNGLSSKTEVPLYTNSLESSK